MHGTTIGLPGTKDVADGIGELNPTDTALFVLIVVILALLTERIIAGWRMGRERKQMWDVSKEFTAAAREITLSNRDVIGKIETLSLLAARREAVAHERDEPE